MNCFLLVPLGAAEERAAVLLRTSVCVAGGRVGAPDGMTGSKVVAVLSATRCTLAPRAGVEALDPERVGRWAIGRSGVAKAGTAGCVSMTGSFFAVDLAAAKTWTSAADTDAAKPQQQRSVEMVKRLTSRVYAVWRQRRQEKFLPEAGVHARVDRASHSQAATALRFRVDADQLAT